MCVNYIIYYYNNNYYYYLVYPKECKVVLHKKNKKGREGEREGKDVKNEFIFFTSQFRGGRDFIDLKVEEVTSFISLVT
jgi:hypothetical protein